MGLLDYGQSDSPDLMSGLDPRLLGNAQFTAEDEKQRRQQMLIAAAAAAFQNMYKPTGQGIGALLGGGLQGWNEAGQNIRRDKLTSAENLQKAIQSQGALQGMQDAQAARKFEMGYNPSSAPQLPSMAPTPQNAAALAAAPKPELYDQLMAKAEAARKAGVNPAPYLAMAEKYRPEYSTTPQVGMDANGQPYNFVLDKSGNEKRLGAGVKPDFAEVNTGDATKFVNRLTLPAGGTEFARNMSPSEKAAAANQAAHLKLAQEAAGRERANQGKPQWDSSSGQFVMAPSATNPTGSAVTPSGFTKPDKPLTESQSKATAYINAMDAANQQLSNLATAGFSGKGTRQQADIVRAGSEGIPYVPGSGAITRASASDNGQKYHNAQLQWTEQVLRFQTGANAPEHEVVRNAATYFPRPGDSNAVIEQKAAARVAMEHGIRLAAGAGSAKVPENKKDDPLGLR